MGFPGRTRRHDLLRRLLAPLTLALVPLLWVADATHRASLTTVGRDQGIFQYIAWALDHGEVDYRDVRDVNGPLIHMIHGAMLSLGSADEHRFHVLDLWATGLTFAFVGWCLPGIVSKRAPRALERLAWGAAGWVILNGQYMLYTYWNQAQRESFADWFLLPSLGLQVLRPAKTERGARLRVLVIAMLSTLTWFAKPTFAMFTLMQAAVLLYDRDSLLTARKKITELVLGGLAGAAIPLGWLLLRGDIRAWARLTFIDVPQIYRFIWAKSAAEIFSEEGPIAAGAFGLAIAALVIGLVSMRELPRRALVIGFAPLCAILNVVVQHKGFGYHYQPITAWTHVGCMLVVVMLAERFRAAPRKRPAGRYAVLVLAAAYALVVAEGMRSSPHSRNVWILSGGETAERRAKEEYFQSFRTYDFFPWDLRLGAQYLRATTSPDARVQTYGMDPYLLFLAGRRSATPYIYAYDLNSDAAMEGGWSNEPTEADKLHIWLGRDQHEHDLARRIAAAPPEAFVFVDYSPLISFQDAWEDFRHCCTVAAHWVAAHYHPAKTFGVVHVWLRDDSKVPDDESAMPRDLRPKQ